MTDWKNTFWQFMKKKSFKFELCNFKFLAPCFLHKNIQAVHEKNKPCPWSICNYASAYKQSLKKHIFGVHMKYKSHMDVNIVNIDFQLKENWINIYKLCMKGKGHACYNTKFTNTTMELSCFLCTYLKVKNNFNVKFAKLNWQITLLNFYVSTEPIWRWKIISM